jgi:hypothetical protein
MVKPDCLRTQNFEFPEIESWGIVSSEKSRSKDYQTKEYKMGGIYEMHYRGEKFLQALVWKETKEATLKKQA